MTPGANTVASFWDICMTGVFISEDEWTHFKAETVLLYWCFVCIFSFINHHPHPSILCKQCTCPTSTKAEMFCLCFMLFYRSTLKSTVLIWYVNHYLHVNQISDCSVVDWLNSRAREKGSVLTWLLISSGLWSLQALCLSIFRMMQLGIEPVTSHLGVGTLPLGYRGSVTRVYKPGLYDRALSIVFNH